MHDMQTVRLAQFFDLRLSSFVDQSRIEPDYGRDDIAIFEFLEALGWLSQGVFCGYFDVQDGNLIWLKLSSWFKRLDLRSVESLAPGLLSELGGLLFDESPFRAEGQMTEGSQRDFELPLFGHALALSNRWHNDKISLDCTSHLLFGRPKVSDHYWNSADDKPLVETLSGIDTDKSGKVRAIAGFIRTLEHLESSAEFFAFAKAKAGARRSIDLSSYCQRIGGLNLWRVPLHLESGRSRFMDLSYLLEFAIRSALKAEGLGWSEIDRPYKNRIDSLISAWEADHMVSLLEPI